MALATLVETVLDGMSGYDARDWVLVACAGAAVLAVAYEAGRVRGNASPEPDLRSPARLVPVRQAPREMRHVLEALMAQKMADVSSGKGTTMSTAELTFDQIRAFLDAEGLTYTVGDEQTSLELRYRMPAGDFLIWIHAGDEPPLLRLQVHIPFAVDEDRRTQAAETVVRANDGLMLGRFDLDMSDGRLDFRTAMPLAETGVSETQFDGLLHSALWTVNRYHRAFGRLLYGDNLSPVEVIAEVEMAEA